MRPLRVETLAAFALALCSLAACGSSNAPTLPDGGPVPDGGVLCTRSSECGIGEGCIGNICTPLPCGGCDSDQVCDSASNSCVPAQGAPCPTVGGCPQGYECNSNHVCSTPCVIDADCEPLPDGGTLVCNSNTGSCAQCVFDSNCTTVQGAPRCDPVSGNCVPCLNDLDCTQEVGPDHFCQASTHTCIAGCLSGSDCNLSNGERCVDSGGDTLDGGSGTIGKCVQCTSATEGTDCSAAAPACDTTGKCVVCTADRYCGPATPRCDTATETCVQCLPSNNANGADCGYSFSSGGPRDPHTEEICDASQGYVCVSGCASDANCGCPVDPSTGKQTACAREYVQEHCDTTKTTSADVTGPSEGACVECTANSQCYCKISGNQNGSDPSTGLACSGYVDSGHFNGARCQNDSCVEGCDTNADCPSGKLCSLEGLTAHTCVQCDCDGRTIEDAPSGSNCTANSATCGWCEDPQGAIGGCPTGRVCDVQTLTCRLKRQSEQCSASSECGDTHDPTAGACIPGAQFCVKSWIPYTPVNAPAEYCDAAHVTGRCGIACDDPQENQCASGVSCPHGSTCDQATAVDTPPGGIANTGEYCTSSLCSSH